MARKRIFEAGALDLLKDIEAGENHGVQLADIAPDANANPAGYNQKEDPEMDGSSEETVPLTESFRRLTEGRSEAVQSFLKSSDGDKSYDSFKDSSYFDGAKNRKGEDCTKAMYVDAVKFLLKNGKITSDDVGNALAGAGGGRSNAYAESNEDDGPYVRGQDFDADNYEQSETLSKWTSQYTDAPATQDVQEVFDDMEDIVREIVTGVADKRHACIAGDPGIGKTYTVRKVVEQYIGGSGKRLTYSAGAMSASITTVAPFFFYHKNNEIIILDDNDKIMMKNCDQGVQNFMKAVLDPSALKKPVTITPRYVSMSQPALDEYAAADGLTESSKGVHVNIDMEALKEGYFRYAINGEYIDSFKITESEKHELSNMISQTRLHEAFDDEDEDFDDDEENGGDPSTDTDGAHPIQMEPSFIFNSSVIFISNLKLKDISPAVADRCECCEISLSLPQFMERLETVIGGLCKGEDYSSRPQWMREWGKQSTYSAFLGIIEAFNTSTTLFGKPIMIRRKFTFRLFEEMANQWCRLASAYAIRNDLNIEDKKVQAKVAEQITGRYIRALIDKLGQRG